MVQTIPKIKYMKPRIIEMKHIDSTEVKDIFRKDFCAFVYFYAPWISRPTKVPHLRIVK